MRTLKPKITIRKNAGGSFSFRVDAGLIDGKRHRKFFASKREARTYARKMQAARKRQGALAFSLSLRQQIDASQAFEFLNPYRVSFLEVAKYYVKHAQPSGGRKLLTEVVDEFLSAKRTAGKKPRYVKELGCKLNNFIEAFGSGSLNEITRAEVQEWLNKQEFSPQTVLNYLRDLGILFRWAMNMRSYSADNIITKIEKPQLPPTETEIFAVSEALSLLFAAHTITAAFKDQVVRVYSLQTCPEDSKNTIVKGLATQPAAVNLLVTINDWRIKSYPFGVKYPFFYDLTAEVFDSAGSCVATNKLSREEVFSSSSIPLADYQRTYKAVLEELLNSKEIFKGLESVASVNPSKHQ